MNFKHYEIPQEWQLAARGNINCCKFLKFPISVVHSHSIPLAKSSSTILEKEVSFYRYPSTKDIELAWSNYLTLFNSVMETNLILPIRFIFAFNRNFTTAWISVMQLKFFFQWKIFLLIFISKNVRNSIPVFVTATSICKKVYNFLNEIYFSFITGNNTSKCMSLSKRHRAIPLNQCSKLYLRFSEFSRFLRL